MSSSTLDRSAVIDTGPIIALVAARQSLDILPLLYSKLVVPRAVWNELMAGGPGCPEIKALRGLTTAVEIPLEEIRVTDARVATLDAGEAAVIQTALDSGISRVIIDEKLGRKAAAHCGLNVTGSLGVLVRAKNLGLIAHIGPALEAMARSGVRISPLLRRLALEQAGELNRPA
jgi:predicted nucleic acid-binding protein